MIFGIAAFIWPAITLLALVILFRVYAIADGITSIIAAFAGVRFRWQLLLLGIVGIAAGIIAFVAEPDRALSCTWSRPGRWSPESCRSRQPSACVR